MKKLLVTLQLLACCSLVAQEQAANTATQKRKSDPCKTECAPDPCPCFQRGDDPIEGMPMTCKYPAAYNHPANTNVEGCWDFYGDVSYLYWYASQEGMDLASSVFVTTTHVYTPQEGSVVFQNFNYTSGFKVGLGANLNVDDWVADLEYTYLRKTTNTTQGTPTLTPGTDPYLFTGWFNYAIIGGQVKSKWKLGLDWLDLTFKRPYYLGRKLIVTPSAGLRASWIRQTLNLTAPNAATQEAPTTPVNTDVSHNNSNSWAIGPRGLIDAHWLIGGGFRFQGNMGASLLYTRFTKVYHSETGLVGTGGPIPTHITLRNYSCLRPMAEANLGIGWGSYFYQNNYHWDLSATYDFNYLWGQNMLKYLAELNGFGRGTSPDDLYLHGLTIRTRFDF